MAFENGKNLGLGMGWDDGADQWGSPMNRNLLVIDTLMFVYVVGHGYTAPADVPAGLRVAGNVVLVKDSSTTEWETGTGPSGNKLALYTGAPGRPWVVFTPRNGWNVILADEALDDRERVFIDGAWVNRSSLVKAGPITEEWKQEVDTALLGLEESVESATTTAGTANSTANDAKTAANKAFLPQPTTFSADLTLANASHLGRYLVSAGDDDRTVTIPADVTETESVKNFPVGSQITIRQISSAKVTIEAAEGMTLNIPAGGTNVMGGIGSTVALYRRSATQWDLAGQTMLAPPGAERMVADASEDGTTEIPSNKTRLILKPDTPGMGRHKVQLPEGQYDGHRISITAAGAITETTILAATGDTVLEPVTSGLIAAYFGVTLEFVLADRTWVPSA